MSSFSSMLCYLRKREGLSQAQLAEKLDVAKSTVSMYENDERKPSFEMLEKIADFFNINMDTLVGNPSVSAYPSDTLTPAEHELIADYRELTPPGQEYIRQTMAMAKMSYSEKSNSSSNMEEAE